MRALATAARLIVAVLAICMSGSVVGRVKSPSVVRSMAGYRTIAEIALRQNGERAAMATNDGMVARLLSRAIERGFMSELQLESTMAEMVISQRKPPRGVTTEEWESLIASRVYILLVAAACSEHCDVSVIGNLSVDQISRILTAGQGLKDISQWQAESVRNLGRLLGALQVNLFLKQSKATLDNDLEISGDEFSEAFLSAVSMHLRRVGVSMTPEELVELLVRGCR